jgi:hypothetical protein
MKKLVFALFLSVIASTALAMENQKTVCTHGDQQRVIEVVYTGEGEVPCEVHYTKDTGSQVLWSAQGEVGYCEEKAAAFIEKQRGWGWDCETAIEIMIEDAQ